MEVSCPLGTTRCIPQEKFTRKPYNKSFIPQACSVKMAGYWPRSFFCDFMVLDSVSVHKHANKELGQYPAILTSQLVNYPYIYFSRQAEAMIHLYNRSEPMSGKSCKASLSSGVPQTKAAFRLRKKICIHNGLHLADIKWGGGGRKSKNGQWFSPPVPRSRFYVYNV